MIVSKQQNSGWGKAVVERLAKDLQSSYSGVKGFSAASLWRMRLFYEAYHADQKLAPMMREISWSNNIIIMEKCKDQLQREFYIRMTRKYGWTKNILIHQIDNQTYEKTLLNQTNFDKTLPETIKNQAKLAVKDEYALHDARKPIGVAEYKLFNQLPKKLQKQLPAPELIATLLDGI